MSKDVRRRLVLLALVVCAGIVPATAPGHEVADPQRFMSAVGTLELGHYDDFDHGRAVEFASLRTRTGTLALAFDRHPSRRLAGSRVIVEGVAVGGRLQVRRLRVLRSEPSRPRRLLSTSATTVRVAVLLVNFANDPATPFTRETARGVILTNADSAAAYFREASFDQLSLVGDVYGWFTIPYQSTACQPGAWADAAKSALAASGVDPAAFDKFVIAFPHSTSCAWNGLGTTYDAWLNGAMNTQTATHELGHTLGFGHSKSMTCTVGGTRVAISPDPSSCSVDEYGDPFDVMGSGTGRHVNNVGKSGLGWLGGARVHDVTTSGSYTLAPAELPLTDLPQLLRLRRADGSTLNLELRRPFGQFFDNFAGDEPVVNGVTIRWTPAGTRSTHVLDANPATPGFYDAPLAPGQTFEDSAGGISITTTGVSDGSATIAILVATNQPDTQPPGAPVGLLATPSSDNAAALSWAAAIDNVAVASYRVSRDGAMVATLPASSIGYADGGLLPGATYRYAVTAVDAAGNAGPAAETTLTMPTPPVRDTIAPAAPPNLTAAAGKARKVMLAWGASSDDVGVAGYRVYRNGAPVATVIGTSFTDSPGGKATTTTYAVVAYDAAGNVSPSSNIASVR